MFITIYYRDNDGQERSVKVAALDHCIKAKKDELQSQGLKVLRVV